MTGARIDAGTKLRNLGRTLATPRVWIWLAVKLRADRVLLRAAALAFQTLLSIVPLSAVGMAAVRWIGGEDSQEALLRFVVERYLPSAAGEGVDAVLPLVRGLDLSSIGLFGLAALLPLMLSLVDAVELTLADMFGRARRGKLWKFTALGTLLTAAPLVAVLTVRYGPWEALGVHDLLTPLALTTLVLFAGFRLLPHGHISARAALTGALLGGFLLSASKAGFGLYAVYLARSIHLVYGAIAFAPLLLLWVLTAWLSVLLGAELASVVHRELRYLEAPPTRLSDPRRLARHRLLRKIARRRAQRAEASGLTRVRSAPPHMPRTGSEPGPR